MSKKDILSLLRESGGYVSGEAMSGKLGVSRAAVWKSIAALRRDGYGIDAKPNRGYFLRTSPGPLTPGAIYECLSGKNFHGEILCLDQVASTNTHLKMLGMNGAAAGTVLVADEQTGGRGRLDRGFFSPKGKGLYLSILLRPRTSLGSTALLTAFSAVAVCEAIEDLTGIKPRIKWVNDIVADEKKLCGILTELSIESESGNIQYIVIGAGINVTQAAEDFPMGIRGKSSSLYTLTGKIFSRAELAAAVIYRLTRMARTCFEDSGKLQEYRERCMTLGREIQVSRGNTGRSALALDLDENCGLVVQYEDGSVQTLQYGEVSVRGRDGYI